jgi:PAS domain S-box-containing protein
MFDQANIGIVQTTIDGHLLAPNPGFCKIIGYAEEEANRLFLRDVTHPDDYEREEELTRQLIAGEIPGYSIEKRYIRKDGTVIWGEMTATLMRDAIGKPSFALAVVEDISERKAAEEAVRESKEHLQLLIESASDYAIFTITPDNIIDSWNAGAKKVFGYTEREIIGKSGTILFTPEDRADGVPEQEIKAAAAKGRAEDERWHIRKDGSRFYASGVSKPVSSKFSNIGNHNNVHPNAKGNDAKWLKHSSAQTLQTQSISSNRIIGSLPDYDAARLMPHLDFVLLSHGAEIYPAGEYSRYVYFPETAIVSYLYDLEDGSTIETAMIGGEGATGLCSALGSELPMHRAQITVGGNAWRIKTEILKQEFARGGKIQTMLLHFMSEHINQISQRLVCKSFHVIEKRLCS